MNEEDKDQDADGDNRKGDFEIDAAIKLPRAKTIRRDKLTIQRKSIKFYYRTNNTHDVRLGCLETQK
jgi:hypothetical protein